MQQFIPQGDISPWKKLKAWLRSLAWLIGICIWVIKTLEKNIHSKHQFYYMKIGGKWAGAFLTFVVINIFILVIEASTGVSLDPFYWLDLILQAINNSSISLMPTTGPFAQVTEKAVLLASFVHIILRLMPSILLAGAVYSLIPDEY